MMNNQKIVGLFLMGMTTILFFTVSVGGAADVITMNQIGDHVVGNKFAVSGTTNLDAGTAILVEIAPSSFQPAQKMRSGAFNRVSGTAIVKQGLRRGVNTWSFDVDTTNFIPDEYLVIATALSSDVQATAQFTLSAMSIQTAPTLGTTQTTPTTPPATLGTTSPTPTPTLGTSRTTPTTPPSTIGRKEGVLPINLYLVIGALFSAGFLVILNQRT